MFCGVKVTQYQVWEYGSHDDMERKSCGFVTNIAKFGIIVFFRVVPWSQYQEWKDLVRIKQKAEMGWIWVKERVKMKK